MKPSVLATVIEVASLTEDRTPAEQRALIEAAMWVDNEQARFLRGHSEPVEPHLTWLVDSTYRPDDDAEGQLFTPERDDQRRPVELTAAQRDQLEKLHDKFVPCERCQVMRGWHAAECLTADLERAGAS